jgi:hypothetical protein
MSTMNSYTRIVATRCSLGTWFVSGICVDILHKGDTEGNNNNNNNNNSNNILSLAEVQTKRQSGLGIHTNQSDERFR